MFWKSVSGSTTPSKDMEFESTAWNFSTPVKGSKVSCAWLSWGAASRIKIM